jgi:indole-3-acetate monooxygenase
LFEAIRESVIFGLAVPKAFGASRLRSKWWHKSVEEFSRQNGSVEWNVVITAGGALCADYLPEDGAREIFGDGRAALVGSLAPSGQATPVLGGYRISQSLVIRQRL